jgi:hypothetical protein
MYGAVPRELDEVPDPYRAGVLRAKDTARQIFGTIKPLVEAFGLAATEQGGGRRPEPRPLPHRFPA